MEKDFFFLMRIGRRRSDLELDLMSEVVAVSYRYFSDEAMCTMRLNLNTHA
jgi:hypothetical protein